MLKYLLVAGTTAIVNLVLVSTNPVMSVEVQNIELISLSEHNALVKVTQVMKDIGAIISQQSAALVLVKYRGQWKISDRDTVMKSIAIVK